MSFYIDPNGINQQRLKSVADELLYGKKQALTRTGPVGWVWVDDDPERFGPASDEETGITVVSSGRLVWPAQEWSRASDLPYRGGLANRLILERFLLRSSEGVTPYNGAACIVIDDPRDGTLHVWTDQFGYHPCFLYREDRVDQCIVTTFPDVLLADSSVQLTHELTSMAEFMRAWRVTPPHTYFTEVKHVGAATHISIDRRANRLFRNVYWQPFEDPFYPNIHAAAEELAVSVRTAIQERTAIAERPMVFVSGGSDSRVLLFSAADRNKVTAVNLFERAADETRIAEALCASAGCRFLAYQRDNDFYPRNLSDTVRWSGAMWSTEDSHYRGFAEQLDRISPDLVMTACTTDWLFKGYGLEKRNISVLGKNLPILGYTNERVDGFLPNVPSAPPQRFRKAIEQRLSRWFAGCPAVLSTPHDRLLVEDRRIRPTAYTVSVSGSIMYRNFPYDTFLADSRIAACYGRIHPDWKLNREVWGRAVARICGSSPAIVDANYGWRVNASIVEKLAVFGIRWVARRLGSHSRKQSADDSRPPSSGSWPELGWYTLHSPTLRRIWDSVSREERARFAEICLVDPWSKPLEDWSIDGQYLFRLLTLLSHWREMAERQKRVQLR